MHYIAFARNALSKIMHNALILNYHSLDISKAGPEYPVDPVYSVRETDFAAQLALIKKKGIPVVSLNELVQNDYKRKRWHRHVVLITFDGGNLTDYENAFPLLKQYKFPATFFITTQNQRAENRWEQWREIGETPGFFLGSHSVSGACLTSLPVGQMQQELLESKQVIEENTGLEVKYFSPPLGRYNEKVIAAAREVGYEALLTTKVGVNSFKADLFQLKRWTVKRATTLSDFENMLKREPRALLSKQMQSQVMGSGKHILNAKPFEKIRSLILRSK
jgi:peptidoglycan/xylan/chitin deacetylase (PgdA/CDA1 family)